ncbi:MAG: hypothetical protein U9P38_06920, partial [Campylobacterota bacterium]|nr:hypothetical protein [Campylobacterota bacterium]
MTKSRSSGLNTQNSIDLTDYLPDTEIVNTQLELYKGPDEEKVHNLRGSIHTEPFALFCPQCKSSRFRKKGKVQGSKRQRYRCSECNRSFSASTDSLNTDLLFASLFETTYAIEHKEQSHMLNTLDRKRHSQQNDPRYMKYFEGRFTELEIEDRAEKSLADIIKTAFRDTNLYVDKLEQELLNKQHDSFTFFLNYAGRDIAYYTEHEHFMLVRRYNIDNFSQQYSMHPLFFCECGSVDIRRHGHNNNGRARLRCQTCDKIFVIRLSNIVHKSYFEMIFKQLFSMKVPNFPLYDELEKQMYHDFYNTKFYDYFEDLVYNLELITHDTRLYIVMLFVNMQFSRYAFHKYYKYDTMNKDELFARMLAFPETRDTALLSEIDSLLDRDNNKSVEEDLDEFARVKNLNFLQSDKRHIDDILSKSKMYESLVPKLFDNEYLLA